MDRWQLNIGFASILTNQNYYLPSNTPYITSSTKSINFIWVAPDALCYPLCEYIFFKPLEVNKFSRELVTRLTLQKATQTRLGVNLIESLLNTYKYFADIYFFVQNNLPVLKMNMHQIKFLKLTLTNTSMPHKPQKEHIKMLSHNEKGREEKQRNNNLFEGLIVE